MVHSMRRRGVTVPQPGDPGTQQALTVMPGLPPDGTGHRESANGPARSIM